MTKILRAVALLATFTCGTPLHAQSRLQKDSALASMIAAERAFSKHSTTKGTQKAFVEYLAPGSLLYRPKVVNAHAFLKVRAMPTTLMLIWEPVLADISRAGDFGFTTGPWLSQRANQPQADPTFGQYVTVWRRQPNGSWKAEINAGIAHGADAIGPKEVRTLPAPAYTGGTVNVDAMKKSLLDADAAFAQLARTQGAANAFIKTRDPNVRLLRNGSMPLTADSAVAHLRTTPQYTWKPVGGGVSRSADLGYTYGVYALPGETGDYLRVWRRDAAGAWKLLIDLTSPE